MEIFNIGPYVEREESTAHVKFKAFGTTAKPGVPGPIERTGDYYEIQRTNGIYSARLVRADGTVEEQVLLQSVIRGVFDGFQEKYAYALLCGGGW